MNQISLTTWTWMLVVKTASEWRRLVVGARLAGLKWSVLCWLLHKAHIISNWFPEHKELTLLQRPPETQDLNPLDHLWDVVGWEIPIIDVQLKEL